MSKTKITLVAILVLVIAIAFSFAMGWVQIFFKNTFGVANANVERNIFEKGKSYIEGMNSDLANYKFEFESSKDAVAKKAIINLIRDKFASFDEADISDYNARVFLRDVRSGKYNNIE